MHRLVVLAFAALVSGAQAPRGTTQHWQPLFNGEDLQGWEIVNGGKWSVEDGTILMRRLPGETNGAWLFTKSDYSDFILRLKFLPGTETFHSGILIREPGHGKITRPAFSGYEVSLAQGIRRENTTGAIYFSANAYEKAIPAKQWSVVEIRCLGDHITTFINGEKAAETHTRRSYRGGIGLHLHGGKDQPEYRWKDIEIQELAPPPREFQYDEEKLAQMPGGFEPLAGLSSSGPWVWNGSQLRAAGAREQSWILSSGTYRNFILEFDFKVSGGGSAGAVFRVPAQPSEGYEFRIEDRDDVNPSGSIFNLARAFNFDVCTQRIYHPGQWNQARIYVTGDHVVTYLNLAKGAEIHSDRSANGKIGFRVSPGTEVEFRKIEVKKIE